MAKTGRDALFMFKLFDVLIDDHFVLSEQVSHLLVFSPQSLELARKTGHIIVF